MEIVEALRVYASSAYKNDIESIMVLFVKLEEPNVKEPDELIKVIKKVDGKKCGNHLKV